MPEETKTRKIINWLETPWNIRQTETHLIFGPISRHLPFGYVLLAGAVLGIITGLFAVHKPLGEYIGNILDKLFFLFVSFLYLRMSCRQQAILGWATIKFTLGVFAYLMIVVGFPVSFIRHQADAWPNLFLGLIWLPHLEFVPSITPHQKYVTIARLLLSIPCIILGIRSGNWH